MKLPAWGEYMDASDEARECPKCGASGVYDDVPFMIDERGFRPTFEKAYHCNVNFEHKVVENLVWTCQTCGYKEESLCRDAKPCK